MAKAKDQLAPNEIGKQIIMWLQQKKADQVIIEMLQDDGYGPMEAAQMLANAKQGAASTNDNSLKLEGKELPQDPFAGTITAADAAILRKVIDTASGKDADKAKSFSYEDGSSVKISPSGEWVHSNKGKVIKRGKSKRELDAHIKEYIKEISGESGKDGQ